MGRHWVSVRDGARDGTLRAGNELADVITRWEQFIQYLSLSLSRQLGVKVTQVLSRKESDPAARRAAVTDRLIQSGDLSGSLRVQHAVGDMTLTASLRARTVTVSVDVDAPGEGQPQTRINWLVRQLKDAPDDLVVDAWYPLVRNSVPGRLSELRQDAKILRAADSKKAPRWFRVSRTAEMGTKRSGSQGSFTEHAKEFLLAFYKDVVQPMKPWTASAPKLREDLDQRVAEHVRDEAIEEQISSSSPYASK
jgi:hypothetical protein